MEARGRCHACRDLQLEWPLLPLFPSTSTELDIDRRHTHSQLCAVSMQSNDNSNDDSVNSNDFLFLIHDTFVTIDVFSVRKACGLPKAYNIRSEHKRFAPFLCNGDRAVDSWKTTRQSDTLWRHNQNNNLLADCCQILTCDSSNACVYSFSMAKLNLH